MEPMNKPSKPVRKKFEFDSAAAMNRKNQGKTSRTGPVVGMIMGSLLLMAAIIVPGLWFALRTQPTSAASMNTETGMLVTSICAGFAGLVVILVSFTLLTKDE